jgi:hypothetical protein
MHSLCTELLSHSDITNDVLAYFFERLESLPTVERLQETLTTPFDVKIPVLRDKFELWERDWKDVGKYFAIIEQVNTLAGDFSYDCMSATGRIVEGSENHQIPKYDRLMGCIWEKLGRVSDKYHLSIMLCKT